MRAPIGAGSAIIAGPLVVAAVADGLDGVAGTTTSSVSEMISTPGPLGRTRIGLPRRGAVEFEYVSPAGAAGRRTLGEYVCGP
jgi:hypothetical protein